MSAHWRHSVRGDSLTEVGFYLVMNSFVQSRSTPSYQRIAGFVCPVNESELGVVDLCFGALG